MSFWTSARAIRRSSAFLTPARCSSTREDYPRRRCRIRSRPVFDIGDRVVARALGAFGVRTLDTFVMTHGDPDHIGGAQRVLRRFRPRAIWEGVPVPPHPALTGLIAAGRGARRRMADDQSWRSDPAGGVEIEALHPPLPEWERQRVSNDDSVVVRDLATGRADRFARATSAAGREVKKSQGRRVVCRLAITVLKAAHHGSATSRTPDFLSGHAGRRDLQRGPRQPLWPPGAGRRSALPRARHGVFSTADDGAVSGDGRPERADQWVEQRTSGGAEVEVIGTAGQ